MPGLQMTKDLADRKNDLILLGLAHGATVFGSR